MVSAPVSRMSGSGLSPGQGHCALWQGTVPLSIQVYMYICINGYRGT